MTSIIGYDNLMRLPASVVTVSSEEQGFEKELCYDWRQDSYWKPTAAGAHTITVDCGSNKNCDYLGVYRHTLSDNTGDIRLFYSDTGTSGPWVALSVLVTPSDNKVLFKTFTSVSKRYYQIQINDVTNATQFAAVSFGARLDLQTGMGTGFMIPNLAFDDDINNNRAIDGGIIGTTVKRKGYVFKINPPDLHTTPWVRANFRNLVEHLRLYPAFFSWDHENNEQEAIFFRTEKNIKGPSFRSQAHMGFDFDCRGWEL